MDVQKECRICFETTNQNQMLSPCDCSGTMAYIHSYCLKKTIELNVEEICRICDQKWNGFTIVYKNNNFINYLKAEPCSCLFLVLILFVLLVAISNLVIGVSNIININEYNQKTKVYVIVADFIVAGLLILVFTPILSLLVIHQYRKWHRLNSITAIETTNAS